MLCRRLLLLKPLNPGLSGYARLQWEGGRTEMQIQLRGLPGGGARFFWYDGQARELGQAQVNPRGEAGLTVSLGENLLSSVEGRALMILSAEALPRPLLLGLPGPADGGTLLEMRAAALALCQRLIQPPQPPAPKASPPAEKPKPRVFGALPREIFLPAIDPAPYMAAQERRAERVQEQPTKQASVRPWADRLPKLRWPAGFEAVRRYFEDGMPCAPFDLPGWRFVEAADAGGPENLWLGVKLLDGAVRRLAYVLPGDQPPTPAFRPLRGKDGKPYQALFQSPEGR